MLYSRKNIYIARVKINIISIIIINRCGIKFALIALLAIDHWTRH